MNETSLKHIEDAKCSAENAIEIAIHNPSHCSNHVFVHINAKALLDLLDERDKIRHDLKMIHTIVAVVHSRLDL